MPSVCEIIAEKIIKQPEFGVAPWRGPRPGKLRRACSRKKSIGPQCFYSRPTEVSITRAKNFSCGHQGNWAETYGRSRIIGAVASLIYESSLA
jgi:hypothetical protein